MALPLRSTASDDGQVQCHTQFVTTQDLRGDFRDSQMVHFAYISQLFETETLSLLDDLIEFAATILASAVFVTARI